ncbi:DUF2599 domain-containing protein [Ornithinicoccus hortensis]|nr:DUF2599 domain-containing protein [Ornithinicoccus hortensis]
MRRMGNARGRRQCPPLLVLGLSAAVLAGCSAAGPDPSPGTGSAPDAAATSTAPDGAATSTAPSGSAPEDASDTTAGGCTEASDLIDSATWIEVDGQSSLEIVPTQELRDCRSLAGPDAGWSDLLDAVPDADSPGMRDQHLCHVRFAPFKDVWHIEPWRPVVSESAMALAACNPGGPDPDLVP